MRECVREGGRGDRRENRPERLWVINRVRSSKQNNSKKQTSTNKITVMCNYRSHFLFFVPLRSCNFFTIDSSAIQMSNTTVGIFCRCATGI